MSRIYFLDELVDLFIQSVRCSDCCRRVRRRWSRRRGSLCVFLLHDREQKLIENQADEPVVLELLHSFLGECVKEEVEKPLLVNVRVIAWVFYDGQQHFQVDPVVYFDAHDYQIEYEHGAQLVFGKLRFHRGDYFVFACGYLEHDGRARFGYQADLLTGKISRRCGRRSYQWIGCV